MNRIPGFLRCGLTAAAIALAGCDSSPLASDDGLLRYVPADTPYVIASVEPLPDDLTAMYSEQAELVLGLMRDMIGTVADDASMNSAPPEMIRAVEGLAELLSPDSMATLGLGYDSRMVLYGHGMLPVFRATLTEGHDFEGFLDRLGSLLAEGDVVLETGSVAGQSYRYLGDAQARVVIAVVGNEFAITMVPGVFNDDQLASMLGLELPAQNIADTGRLAEIADKYEYSDYMIAMFDVERFAGTFLGSASSTDAALLEMTGYDAQSISTVCRDEFRDMAAVAPLIAGGYTELGTDAMEMSVVVELREDIAAGLATIPVPLAGMGVETDALMSYGMAFDIAAARDFVMARLDALEADPFRCEALAAMSAEIPMARMMLSQPQPPYIEGLSGFSLTMDIGDLDLMMPNSIPQDFSGAILIATEDAAGLIAMGALFDPQIAALDLGTDGEIVELSLPPGFAGPGMEAFETMYVAATPSALAAGFGADAEARLQQLLDAPAAAPGTFLSMSIDMQQYYGMISDSFEMAAMAQPGMPAGLLESMTGMMRAVQNLYSREYVDVRFTENGIEIPVRIEVAD